MRDGATGGRGRKVLVVAAEKSLMVEHVPLLFHAPDPEFRAFNPLGAVASCVEMA